MAFGKAAGPPASHQQLNDLLELLQDAGHEDFRDARGPMGFNQRQAGGKFTRDEAQQFIDQLEAAVDEMNEAPAREPAAPKLSPAEQALREISSEDLAAELRRRGYEVSQG
jgi:hypothetical protein